MADQEKDNKGRFTSKSSSERKIRSLRATDHTWDLLGEKAEENDMTRADLLEALVFGQIELEKSEEEIELDFDIDEVAEILKEALTLKSNAGGKIKTKIREVLEIMNIELDNCD